MSAPRFVLLDSCAVVNFYASAHMGELLDCIDGQPCISDYVQRESQFIRNATEGNGENRERIQLDPFLSTGLLRTLTLESEVEFESFIQLALRLDDGEAATLAIAASRSGIVITDDRKAASIASELSTSCLTSLEIVKAWTDREGMSPRSIRTVLQRIRYRARYEPGRQHALRSWWLAMLESGEVR